MVGNILTAIPWWTAYLVGGIGVTVLGSHMLVNSPDAYEVIFFTVLTLFWVGLCGFWAGLAKSSLERQMRILDELGAMIDYVNALNEVFRKSLDGLSTYDRDKAIALAEEINTVTSKSLYDAYWRDESERRMSE